MKESGVKKAQAGRWAARRFAGVPVSNIARRAHVSISTVHRATDPLGPFPTLVKLDGRLVEVEIMHARWVARRRAGEGIRSIAQSDSASPATIRKVTGPYGPFPPPRRPRTWTSEDQERWIQLRHDSYSTTRIAALDNVSNSVVHKATRDCGPYPIPTRRHPYLLSLSDLAELTGVRGPTTYGWWHRGLLPDPHTTGRVGQPLWERGALEAWCKSHLTTCPRCGTRALGLTQHLSKRHVGGDG